MIVCLLVTNHGIQQAIVIDRARDWADFIKKYGKSMGIDVLQAPDGTLFGRQNEATTRQQRYYIHAPSIEGAIAIYRLLSTIEPKKEDES